MGAGIDESKLAVSVSGNNIVLTAGATDQVTIVNGVNYAAGQGVQQVQFADHTVLTASQLLSMAAQQAAAQPSGTLSAPTSGNHTFDTGGAFAAVQGDGASDTFVYNVGYGALTINQQATVASDESVLAFGSDISAADVAVYASGNDLVLALSATARCLSASSRARTGPRRSTTRRSPGPTSS